MNAALLSTVAGTVTQGRVAAREAGRLARELLRISVGSSAVAPAKGDWRFADPTWTQNPVYRRIGQAYLSFAGSMDRLAAEAEKSGRDPDKARFAVTLLTSAVAPTNSLLGNPAAIKRTLETGGGNLARGVRNWAGDLRHNGGLPSMTDPQALQVGRDLALTPGAVVERDEVAELIQYTPATGRVRERPVLVVPPPIGRYYFLDLRPGRSFIEYSAGRGLQTFVLSWRNPGQDQRDWDLDTYTARVLRAIDAIRDITGSADVNTIGFCAGGIITTGVLNHLAATRDARIHSASFLFQANTLCRPAAMTILHTPVDLATITVPVFATGAMTDHLTPWKGCYRTTQLLSGPMTFVLSNSGHIQSLVNPPGNPKASYYTGQQPGQDADQWLAAATRHAGSWWEAWADWITPHSGAERAAPRTLGSPAFEPMTEAPGDYVRQAPGPHLRRSNVAGL